MDSLIYARELPMNPPELLTFKRPGRLTSQREAGGSGMFLRLSGKQQLSLSLKFKTIFIVYLESELRARALLGAPLRERGRDELNS